MSLVFLKNIFSPSTSPLRRSRRELPAEVHLTPVHEMSHAPEPVDFTGNDKTVSNNDVEAQQCDNCRPPQEEASKSRRCKIEAWMIGDAILGLSDGLTVPFALTAGLAFLGDTRLVVLGGLAELIAGAISMGLGGYLGTKTEDEAYRVTVNQTRTLIRTSHCQTHAFVHAIFTPYHLPNSTISSISKTLHDSPAELLDFLMRFHHQLPPPASNRALISAVTIAMGYFVGGFVPLLPYLCVKRDEVMLAFFISIGVMAVALFVFGWVKTGVVRGWRGWENVWRCVRGALQMVVVGGVAAGAAVGLVRAIGHG